MMNMMYIFQELKDQEAHIEHLKASIKAKQTPLSIAKARLAMRTKVQIFTMFTTNKDLIEQMKASIKTK
jgi:hypothetical protein